MIKKLRGKFIFISISSITIVLFLIIGTINVFNYIGMNERSNQMLSLVIENNGELPRPQKDDKPPKNDNKFYEFSPQAMFDARYFVVLLDENTEVMLGDNFVSSQQAQAYAKAAVEINKNTGFLDNYKFLKANINGSPAITFIDCSRDIELFQNFLKNSIIISLLALLLVFVILYFLSTIAIRPIVIAYEKQKEFITNATHEIKTPITVISANTDIIEMSIGESKWIKSTKSQIVRLTELINNLISLARLEEENYLIEKSEFPLSDMAEMVAESYNSIAIDKNKTFETSISPGIKYYGNEKNISQLFYLLLDNAFRYSNAEGIVKLMVEKQQEKVIIEVYNTTDEIKKGDHSEFFDRFYREDKSHNSNIAGSGIGLSLAKSIVSSHKGKITAKSTDGNSLTIKINL